MSRRPPQMPAIRPSMNVLAGEIYCDRQPRVLRTILGSCVAVCLWDRRLRFGGMNHFLLPRCPLNAERSTRYGDVAIPVLIEKMLGLGSRISDLQAKIFGGANVLRSPRGGEIYSVGKSNAEVAISELNHHRISVVACRLSGNEGVVILQCTDCGDVWLRPISSSSVSESLPDDVGEDAVLCSLNSSAQTVLSDSAVSFEAGVAALSAGSWRFGRQTAAWSNSCSTCRPSSVEQ
ncbi:chemotaxis protein CheD [Azospirillaceae bacterium]